MFIRKVADKKSGCTRIQICESYRESGKVKQKIVRHVGIARNSEEVEKFAKLAAGLIEREIAKSQGSEPLFTVSEEVEKAYKTKQNIVCDVSSLHEEVRHVEGPREVLGRVFEESGFGSLFSNVAQKELLKNLVTERIANPDSKLGTAESSEVRTGEKFDVNRIYRLMDALHKKNENILETAFASAKSLYDDGIDLVCFDVTTLYFESVTADELKAFGYSKDQKFHSVQVTLALATTREGVPVGYKLFPGNTSETKTLLSAISEWKKILPIRDVVFVADRGMFSFANLKAIADAGYTFIVAAPLRRMGSKMSENVLDESAYQLTQVDEDKDVWWARTMEHTVVGKIKDEGGNSRSVPISGKMLVTWSKGRAKKDADDRDRLLKRMRSILENNSESAPKKLVSNAGYKKYASFRGKTLVAINEDKVEQDSQWDGIHGIFTNGEFSAKEIINRYRHLLSIEDSFRISKHELKMRPIYHYSPRRISAHIALCFISLCVIRRLQIELRKKKVVLSVTRIREALNSVQATILTDAYKMKIRVPSKMTDDAKAIYETLSIRRRMGVTQVQN